PVEVGFVAGSAVSLLRELGVQGKSLRKMVRDMADVPPQVPLRSIQLDNKYNILDLNDFPLLANGSQSPPSLSLPSKKNFKHSTLPGAHHRSMPQFTPAPQRAAAAILPAGPPPPRPKSPSKSPSSSAYLGNLSPVSHRRLFPPTTLIIGDSITRNIRFFNAITRCFPGATVQIILDKLPGIFQSLPSTVRKIIAVFISGPIPPYNHGCGLFSRILGLNSWLLSACRTHNTGFIDNFNLFWNRPSFRSDGTLPNKLGSSVLMGNIQHAVQSLPQD
uniref:SGNH hydrolase-type esterase domain-containing protein n=1 Tax=Amphiprion percula TaxID=161767 RepID=A0A3P8SY60_AMPPE